MNEYIKNLMGRWMSYFSRRLEFERNKSGFSSEAAKLAAIIELMKEQVPNENTSHTTR